MLAASFNHSRGDSCRDYLVQPLRNCWRRLVKVMCVGAFPEAEFFGQVADRIGISRDCPSRWTICLVAWITTNIITAPISINPQLDAKSRGVWTLISIVRPFIEVGKTQIVALPQS